MYEYKKDETATRQAKILKKRRKELGFRQEDKYSLLSVVRRRQYCNYSQALHRYDDLPNMDFMLTDQIRSGLPIFPA